MRSRIALALFLTALPVLAGCEGASARAQPAPAVHVDSARTVEEELARFRTGLREPRHLAGGERSRDALVTAFVRAVEQRDTVRLRELHLDPAEFAYFYYPYTRYTHPPYQQAPGMVWMITTQNSQKGITRVLRRYAGAPLGLRGYRCPESEPQDINTLHTNCGLLLAGDTATRRFFGSIIEREGRFKFVSYANDL